MKIKNFKDMYIAELQKLVSMESQIDIALKRMADAASHPSLKRELLRHRGETKERSKRLQSILQKHNACCTRALKKNGRPTPHSPNSPRAK